MSNLRTLVHEDPFGKPYKVTLKKLKGFTAKSRKEPEDVEKAIDKSFPYLAPVAASVLHIQTEEVPPISTEKVDAVQS